MNLRNITNVILNRVNSVDGLATEYNISCDFISDEFNQIDLHSVNKKGKSFTVLVLPKIPKDVTVNGKKIEELFGDNSKGGEK